MPKTGSVITNCFIDVEASRPLGSPALFTFPNEGGDCVVRLDGLYITDLANMGVRGQIRVWWRRRARWYFRKRG